MKPFYELLTMTDEEKLSYLKEEAEKVIQGALPKHQLKLRALQAKCDGIRAKVKDPFIRADRIYCTMQDSFFEMNEVLKPFRKE